MPPLPPVTIATLPVKSKSGAMLKLLVLTLPAVAPTIPHREGSSPPDNHLARALWEIRHGLRVYFSREGKWRGDSHHESSGQAQRHEPATEWRIARRRQADGGGRGDWLHCHHGSREPRVFCRGRYSRTARERPRVHPGGIGCAWRHPQPWQL